MIKSFKLFESNKYWQERVDRIMNQINSSQIGDILSEDIIYQYVQIYMVIMILLMVIWVKE